MSRIRSFAVIFVVMCLFTTCQEDDSFDLELLPGVYSGSIFYFAADRHNVPELSKAEGYTTTITTDGSGYQVSFDDTFTYTLPDLNMSVVSIVDERLVSVEIDNGFPYSDNRDLNNNSGLPENYFATDDHIRRIRFDLTLKSNDPDSVYYLNIGGMRTY